MAEKGMAEKEVIVSFKNLSFAYEGDKNILEDVNAEVYRGDYVSVVGPNGGGKTTFLKLVLGLLKPTQGEIGLFGRPHTGACDRIGYVPQFSKFDANFPASVRDVVLMGALNRGFWWGGHSKAQKAKALEAIEAVGLQDHANASFAQLSGGQRQRALIARAIMSDPELLLLDEPTANIDASGTEQLYAMFAEMNKRFSILMVSHDLGFVTTSVNRVFCIKKSLQIHPVSELTGDSLQRLYGGNVHLVRHDHSCSEKGHLCHHS
jgi:zinc transport system ATP-binding protein